MLDEANAVQRLGQLAMRDAPAYAAYCARTKAHRITQRQFILEHPGCIPDKERRIRTLSALRIGVPRIETKALQWALLMQSRAASEASRARAAAEKGAKKSGGAKGKPSANASSVSGAAMPPTAFAPGTELDPFTTAGVPTTALPTLEALYSQRDDALASREKRRDVDDVAEGFDV